MDLSIFKFLLKNGLAFPRNKEELDYIKENVFTNDEDVSSPTFEETWDYITKNQSNDSPEASFQKLSSSFDGMARAARFRGDISDEIKQQMKKDKEEAKNRMCNNDRSKKRENDC